MDSERGAGALEVGGGENREDAGRRSGGRGVEPGDPPAGNRAPQATDVEVTFRLQVIDELTTAAEKARVLQPPQASSDRSGVGHPAQVVNGGAAAMGGGARCSWLLITPPESLPSPPWRPGLASPPGRRSTEPRQPGSQR